VGAWESVLKIEGMRSTEKFVDRSFRLLDNWKIIILMSMNGRKEGLGAFVVREMNL